MPPEAGAVRALPVAVALMDRAVYDEGFWSRVDAWAGQFGLTGPAGIVQASEGPGAG